MLKLYKLIIFLLIISPVCLVLNPVNIVAQAPDGLLLDYFITVDKDTVSMKRKHGPFWFGAMGGGNFNFDMGEVKFLRKPFEEPDSSLNQLIKYTPDIGSGYFMGAVADWQPVGSYWGGSIRAYILDIWTSSAYAEKYHDTLQSQFDNTTKFTYLTFSPAGRFNFHPNFHLFAGFDLAMNLSYSSTLKRNHIYTGDINHDYSYEKFDMKMRYGGHAGIAWEIVLLDVNQRMRLVFSPFISVHAGTAMISDNESSWNTVTLRAGITLKLGPDEIEYDTLKYVPGPEPIVPLLASLDRRSNIAFPGFDLESFVVRGEMAAVERKMVEEEFKIEPVVNQEVIAKPEILKAIAEKAEIALAGTSKPKEKVGEAIKKEKLVEDVDKIFDYATSDGTDLARETRKYLDNVADYLKEHPGATLAITGHSDDQGTFEQNDQRARLRAQKAADYLMSKGIAKSRLLANGSGSIKPVASNKTEAGRRKNRRLEIRIVPSGQDARRRR